MRRENIKKIVTKGIVWMYVACCVLESAGITAGAAGVSDNDVEILEQEAEAIAVSDNALELETDEASDFSNAANINIGSTVNDSITETVSARVYKFSLPSAGRLGIDITSYMQYYTIQIFDESGSQIWSTDNNAWNGNLKYRQDGYGMHLVEGSYYIKVTGHRWVNETWGVTGNYSFKTEFQSANETFKEYNNDFTSADSIEAGQTINGQIAINDSMDIYIMQLASAGRWQLDMTSYMQYYTVEIYDAAGSRIWSTDNNAWNGNLKYRQDNYQIDLIAGLYYMKISGRRWVDETWGVTGNYTFSTSFQTANETFAEPNNDFTTANRIYLGQTINGQIACNDSKDIYVYNLAADTGVTLQVDSYMAYYTVEIYDVNGKLVWYTDDNYWNESVRYCKDIYDTELSAGQYYMCVTGRRYKGSSGGWSTGNYTIAMNARKSLSGATVSKISDKSYTGNYIKPTVKVIYQGKTLKQDTDYTVEYTDNLYVGTATVTITGKWDYFGTKVVHFKIKPAKPKKVSAKNAGRKKVLIRWQNTSQDVYYVVYRSTKKNSGYKKRATVKNRYATSYIDKKVKRKKTYYYKVRTCTTGSGKRQYSNYTTPRKVKTK